MSFYERDNDSEELRRQIGYLKDRLQTVREENIRLEDGIRECQREIRRLRAVIRELEEEREDE